MQPLDECERLTGKHVVLSHHRPTETRIVTPCQTPPSR
jgi:hypothetical protein